MAGSGLRRLAYRPGLSSVGEDFESGRRNGLCDLHSAANVQGDHPSLEPFERRVLELFSLLI